MIDTRMLLRTGSFLKRVWRLAAPFWRGEERAMAWFLLAAVVGLALGLVYLDVLFNYWNRDFYNALQEKSFPDFKDLLLYFGLLAAIYIFGYIYRVYLTQMLQMRWRAWLTRHYLADWMAGRAYYRLELERSATDNPDQRIAEDLNKFTAGTLSLGLGLLSSVVTLASFAFILWSLSGSLTIPLGSSSIEIPGYMLWAAVLYAIVGSVLTHYVGRRLIGLNFVQERYEADFRFNLVRFRENAEGVALYHGEDAEQRSLLARFGAVITNWWEIMRANKRLNAFTAGYSQLAIIFPFVVGAPRYFSGEIDLGTLMQVASAFGTVQAALSWFVSSYSTLADWKASVDRLLTFHGALEDARTREANGGGVRVERAPDGDLAVDGLDLVLPDGRVIVADARLAVARGERVLVSGPSGSGKSTLFRALAGIWPYGRGRVRLPAGAEVMFLPQKPYIPIAPLRTAVAYPAPPDRFDDVALRDALAAVRLDAFAARLDETGNWSMVMSGGEQQKLAVARALLHRPDWLFLDEATSALDEDTERHLYALIRARLPDTTLVSIAHRAAVAAHHGRRIAFEAGGDGLRLVASPIA
jgi:putative ATP-binding cassette transporter